jgi:hypothetical protein
MSQRMVHAIRAIAREEVEHRWAPALGIVTSVHGSDGFADHSCTVRLRESDLVLPRVPIATGNIGTVALPREGDLVVVGFLGGDLHGPVVLGRLYNEQVAPPEHGPGQVVVALPGDETADDKRLVLTVDTPGDGSRRIGLVLDGRVRVAVTVDDEHIALEAQDASLTLRQTSSSDGRAELTVGGSSVVIDQGGDVDITASGTLRLQATSVEISGDATVKLAGQTIDLN